MKSLAALIEYVREFWARDKYEPPYPLTYDEVEYLQELDVQPPSEEPVSEALEQAWVAQRSTTTEPTWVGRVYLRPC